MGFKGEFRQWEDLLRIGRLITGAYRDPISDVRRIPELETECFTEEDALSARKHDLSSVL